MKTYKTCSGTSEKCNTMQLLISFDKHLSGFNMRV